MTDSIDGIKRVIVWPPTQRSCSYRLLNWFSAVNSAINWSYSLEANSFAMVKEKEKKKKKKKELRGSILAKYCLSIKRPADINFWNICDACGLVKS